MRQGIERVEAEGKSSRAALDAPLTSLMVYREASVAGANSDEKGKSPRSGSTPVALNLGPSSLSPSIPSFQHQDLGSASLPQVSCTSYLINAFTC